MTENKKNETQQVKPQKEDKKIKTIQTRNASDFDDILSGKAKNN